MTAFPETAARTAPNAHTPGVSVFDRVEELLPLVSKPIQYVGGEVNAVSKDGKTPLHYAAGKGHVVYKFSNDGKLLMTLGKMGQPGSGDNQFFCPADVITGADGNGGVWPEKGGVIWMRLALASTQ